MVAPKGRNLVRDLREVVQHNAAKFVASLLTS